MESPVFLLIEKSLPTHFSGAISSLTPLAIPKCLLIYAYRFMLLTKIGFSNLW